MTKYFCGLWYYVQCIGFLLEKGLRHVYKDGGASLGFWYIIFIALSAVRHIKINNTHQRGDFASNIYVLEGIGGSSRIVIKIEIPGYDTSVTLCQATEGGDAGHKNSVRKAQPRISTSAWLSTSSAFSCFSLPLAVWLRRGLLLQSSVEGTCWSRNSSIPWTEMRLIPVSPSG